MRPEDALCLEKFLDSKSTLVVQHSLMQSANKVHIHGYVLGVTYNFLFSSTAELSKHKRYEIRMSVYNAVGEGPTSPPQEVFVGEAGMYTSCQLCQRSYTAAAPHILCADGFSCRDLSSGVTCLLFYTE